MEWLASNWVWILVGIGLIWFMSRGPAGMGCCGGSHSHGTPKETPEPEEQKTPTPTKSCCH